MRKFMCAVLVLLAAQTGLAGEIVMQEDFESAGYTIGSQVDVGSPLLWTLGGIDYPAGFVCPDGSLVDPLVGGPVDGRWARICAPRMASTGGTKASEFVDIQSSSAPNESAWGIKAGMTSTALQNYNSGNGVQKGYVQWDWYAFSAINHHVIFAIYDEYPGLSGDPDYAKCLTRLNFNQGAGGVNYLMFEGGGPTRSITQQGGNKWEVLTAYRTRVTFDLTVDPKVVSCQMWSGAPDFTTVNFDSNDASTLMVGETDLGPIAIMGDATFKGVRGFMPYALQQTNRNPAFEVDNIVVWSDISAGPSPEVAVTVDAADVADGGSVNFGAPAVGVPTSKTFTVANTGTADLTTANLVLPAGYTLAAGSDLAATITPASSDDFIVELDTATEGIKGGEITFDTNDSDENPFNITVTANVGSTSVEEWTER